MPVFYRTYRPQRFAEVVGQQPIVHTLRNAVHSQAVAHAYLFSGSRGIGKTSLARILAKAVNCRNPEAGDADGTCDICMSVQNNSFLDLIEIDAASNTGVENVRELIEHVRFQPSIGTYKVFIIDEVHMLSKAAFNALLKTLEEPPAHAIFILATTDAHKVPETIVSRTQRFDFKKITDRDIVAQLRHVANAETLNVSDAVLALVARSAEGGMRDALSALQKVATLGPDPTTEAAEAALGATSTATQAELYELIALRTPERIPAVFDRLLEQGVDFLALNRGLLEYGRQLLVVKVTGKQTVTTLVAEDAERLIAQASKFITPQEVMRSIRLLLRAYKEAASAPSAELPLLLSCIEAASTGSAPVGENRVVGPDTAPVRLASTPSPAIHPLPLVTDIAEPVSLPVFSPSFTPAEATAIFESASGPAGGEPVTDTEVRSVWPDVIERIKIVNSPLATLVRNSPIEDVRHGTVTLAVKYLFHKEHLESKKNYALINSIVAELCDKPARIVVRIRREESATTIADSLDAIGGALKVFGGELVE